MADGSEVTRSRPALTASHEAVAGIVHDLRAPLAAATGYVQLLTERGDALGEEGRARALADALEELRRTAELVEGLLTAAADPVATPCPVDLADVADAAVRTGRGLVGVLRSGHTLRLDVRSAAPVLGDRQALLRIVTNLVDNAVRHSAPGTVIDVGVLREGGRALVRVRDRGRGAPGVPESARAGLGLRIVRALVEAHAGELRVDAVADGGTLAEVALPAAVDVPMEE